MKQTIKVPLADIKQFKRSASFIKSNGVIPVLDYIKFDNGEISKNNLREFAIYKSTFSGSFLVEERVLFNFIEYANSNDILFTINEKKITISDGSTQVTSQTAEVSTFPAPDVPINNKTELSSDILTTIFTAAKYTQEEEFHTIKPYVFVGNKSIAASDGFIGFFRKFDMDLPEIVLSQRTAEKIGPLSSVNFSENERYHFFESGKSMYGFIKPDAKFRDLGNYFLYTKDAYFTINKNDFLSFNDTCVAVSPSKTIYPIFEMTGTNLNLSMIDEDYNLDVKKSVPVAGKIEGSFKYIAALMSKILKTAPDDDLTFYQSEKKFYITGDSGFTSLIMEIIA